MSYVIYGTGAVGGVIAARLHTSGADVTAVARGAHLSAIREKGLTVVSSAGSEVVPLDTAANAGEVKWTDESVVFLTVKSHQTQAALDDLAAHAPHTVSVVVAQNGVSNESAVLRRFRDVYGVAVVLAAAHLEPGVVVQQTYPIAGVLDLGRFPAGTDARAKHISATLRDAGFRSTPRDDIMAWKYRKLIGNLANGVSASFRPGRESDLLTRLAREEAESVLDFAGIAVTTAEQDEANRGDLGRDGFFREDLIGSTWQSVTRGHTSVETDWFNGEIVLLARLHGTLAPVNELIQRTTFEHARLGREPRSLDPADALAELGRTELTRTSR